MITITILNNRFIRQFVSDFGDYEFVNKNPDFTVIFGRTDWENIKVSKSSIWYLLVEKQDNELQMVKYNHKKGVDLSKFVKELKTYYISKNASNKKVCEMIESISIDGNDKYSWIKNIPMIEVDGKKMVTRITEDLIKLLSK